VEAIWWFVGFLVLGALMYGGQLYSVAKNGNDLAQKFAALGVVVGKSKPEILEAVGQPMSISAIGDNQVLLQWQAGGYHIALAFTGEVCDGITHEQMIQV
jgi:hypothetical protein